MGVSRVIDRRGRAVAAERTGIRMNQGRPPYGDPSAWGGQPQAGQGNVSQNGYDQGGYGGAYGQSPQQPYGVPQPSYPQQGQQPYQQPYDQSNQPYAPYGQVPYGQGMGYEQPVQQPYMPQETQQAPYGAGQQQGYPPYGQPSQPNYPRHTYSGYVSVPAPKRGGDTLRLVASVVILGVLPVLFILALVLGYPVLKWIAFGLTLVALGVMWLREIVSPNTRLMLTLVYGAMAVVALVSALSGTAPDSQNPAVNPQSPGISSQGNIGNQGQTGNNINLPQPETEAPATDTPEPVHAVDTSTEDQLLAFLAMWSRNDLNGMLSLTAPSWRREQKNATESLFYIQATRVISDYECTGINGTPNDTTRTATVKGNISRSSSTSVDRYSFRIVMVKEDGEWYVDPRSLESHEKESTEKPVGNNTPTQPAIATSNPELVLYYNPDGGNFYHVDQNCESTQKQYLPFKGSFYYKELSSHSGLKPCDVCGAPSGGN